MQVADFIKLQNEENPRKRRSEVHGGYTDILAGQCLVIAIGDVTSQFGTSGSQQFSLDIIRDVQ
jgi:hypothetical protein